MRQMERIRISLLIIAFFMGVILTSIYCAQLVEAESLNGSLRITEGLIGRLLQV